MLTSDLSIDLLYFHHLLTLYLDPSMNDKVYLFRISFKLVKNYRTSFL